LQLGNDFQFFLRRGQSPAPGRPTTSRSDYCYSLFVAPPPTVTAPSPVSAKAPSTPLIRKPIFKTNTTSPVQTAIDSLASDGYMTQAADVGASHIPELFRSIESIAPPVNAGVAEIKKVEAEVKTWADTMRTDLTKLGRNYMHLGSLQALDSVEKWWSRERTDKVVQRYLGNRETDVLIVDCTRQSLLFTKFDADHLSLTNSAFTPNMCLSDGGPIRRSPTRHPINSGSFLVLPDSYRGVQGGD
jgi:nucleoporin NDC1